jgi:prophage regulatory protein
MTNQSSNIAPARDVSRIDLADFKILTRKEVRAIVPYSDVHRDRLSKAGKFPVPLKLSERRVGYLEREVLAWIEERAAARTGGAA